jgi:hypothetical protein
MWREVMPRVGPGRLLAPDLIGMGRSGKPDIAYDAWLAAGHHAAEDRPDEIGAAIAAWADRHGLR